MTQLENLIEKFINLAEYLENTSTDETEGYIETVELLNKLRDGSLTASKIANDHIDNDPDTAYMGWSVEDILYQAGELEIDCSLEEAREILNDIAGGHDATIGINWDVISEHLYSLERSKKRNENTQKDVEL